MSESDETQSSQPSSSRGVPRPEALGFQQVLDVPVELSLEVGRAQLPVESLLELGKGSVITLDRRVGELLDIRINGKIVAKGDVVEAGDQLAVRIVELVENN